MVWCWIWLAKMAPRPAIPVAMPTWRKVELAPDPMPLRSTGTTATDDEASTGLTIPMPAPASRNPGRSWVHPDPGVVVAISSRPTATSSSPMLIGNRLWTLTVRRPAIGCHQEGHHRDGQEPDPGGERTVAQAVLDVEGDVQEQGEDRRRQREGRDRYPGHGRPAEQRQVEHRIGHPQLGQR